MNPLRQYVVSEREGNDLFLLAEAFLARHPEAAEDPHLFDRPDVQRELASGADALPSGVRRALQELREGRIPYLLLRRVLQDGIGPTPSHWIDKVPDEAAQRLEAVLFLLGGAIGKPLGITTCQKGHLVQEVVPIAGYETQLFSSSSETVLYWHTEDAFLDAPARWLHLACIRNQERVPTRLSAPDLGALPGAALAALEEPRFEFLPDVSHMIVPKDAATDGDQKKMAEANERPPKVPLVTSRGGRRKLLYDEPYLGDLRHDPVAQSAFAALKQAIDDVAFDVVLEPGDLLYIDNHRAVHARGRFKARYDGTDRWLKRMYLVEHDFVPRLHPEVLIVPEAL